MGSGTRVPPDHRSIKVGREGGSLPETGQGISKGAEINIGRAVPKTPFFCLIEVKFPKCRNHHFKVNHSVEFKYIHSVMQPSPVSHSRTFSSSQKETFIH